MAPETPRASPSKPSNVLVALGSAAAFIAAARLGNLAVAPAGVGLLALPGSPLAPASGVAVAALVRFGPPAAWGIGLATVALAALVPTSHAAAPVLAFRALLEALLIVGVYRGCSWTLDLDRTDSVLRFALAALVASAVGASVGMAALVLLGGQALGGPALASAGISVGLGDALGILVTAPLLLHAPGGLFPTKHRGRTALSLLLVAIASIGLLHGVASETARVALAGLMFPLLLVVAVGSGPGPTAIALVMLGASGLAASFLHHGPFSPHTRGSPLIFQTYQAIATLTALVVASAVSERRRSEDALRLHAFAANRAPDAMFMITREGHISWANEAASESLGYSADELSTLEIAAIDESLTGPAFEELWTRLGRDRAFHREASHRTRAGGVVPVEVAVAHLERDREGDAPLAFFHVRDVSSRVAEAERHRALETQLRHAQKMEAIGTLAGGIAHDFNNVLAAILGNVEFSLQDEHLPQDIREALADVQTAGGRARALVGRLSSMSRREEPRLELVDVSAVLEEVARLLRATLPATIQLSLELPRGPVPLPADGAQLHQALVNLGTNAAHAMKGGGTLSMGVAAVSLRPAEAKRRHIALRPDDYIRVHVRDTGHGMSAETKDRIFEPFFTTKPPGEGTGLGLAVVHGIVEGHQGAIVVDSAPGQGTTFELYFPATSAKFTPPKPAPAETVTRLTLRVLLVDDDTLVLAACRRTLDRAGCRVTAVSVPEEALALLQARPDDYDVLVTDVTMPGLSGPDLARAFRLVRPGFPVVAITGYDGAGVRQALDDAGVQDVLTKPFADAVLLATLARLPHRR